MPYRPENPPQAQDAEVQKLAEYLARQLQLISLALETGLVVEKRTNPPAKLVEGMIVRADGVKWDPGFGPGFYGRVQDGWAFLG